MLALGYATSLGAASPSQVMQIGIGLKDPDAAGEAALERARQNPSSPEFRRFLTPAQLDGRFGVPQATFSRVPARLQHGGARVIETAGTRNDAEVSAAANQVDPLSGTHGSHAGAPWC